MNLKPKLTIADHFALVDDPRIERTKQHKLLDFINHVFNFPTINFPDWA